jgi:ribosomal protein S18
MANAIRGEKEITLNEKKITLYLRARDIAEIDEAGIKLIKFLSEDMANLNKHGDLNKFLNDGCKILSIASHGQADEKEFLDYLDVIGLTAYVTLLGEIISRLINGVQKKDPPQKIQAPD